MWHLVTQQRKETPAELSLLGNKEPSEMQKMKKGKACVGSGEGSRKRWRRWSDPATTTFRSFLFCRKWW